MGKKAVKARPVYEEPETTLDAWSIVMGPECTPRFAGFPKRTRLRLSTAVEFFDLDAMTGTTASGRRYRLEGARNDSLGVIALSIFRSPAMAKRSRTISPEELSLMLSPPVNGMKV